MKDFIIGRAKSLKYAIRGMFLLLKTEHSIISQLSISFVLIVMGFYFEISRIEWIIQILLIGFVLAVEGMNTAVEKLCDFIHPEFHSRIGFIKDIAAGAVSFAAISSMTITCIIYYHYIF
ncbi:diacylglycerol kinase family protein [Tenacibaculum finnmarkense genomovar finnmarkense]|uniref:diacylglycerol kinase family protein n=1 Tax=Tenacibaculum finnmarkense TaxID=2781243 RepID=UPI001E3F39AB|nr:diacylglycerol kinase family protein [Tenacibaculum finnmarkense]MCD8416387.1 diacylglycerol kinase family protein [Tenacibaculum finnmarkense genomovar finnmarkense]MCG8185047.1 diacylglycerol kinase family protein [Tenacibaculum finnmarkense genomovar finnmarkense]MCG8201119.1 diacylglycerol kinase family protein [Tenacibaculum finnmarkense genomovar finnmarkense]MCG8209006.1 diacylglycerol kinase family protein [Tenacibaculum finnmarkense genomovar finnmarkense]MCG8211679.1 diacylglycero